MAYKTSNGILFGVDSTQCLFNKGLFDQYCLIPAFVIITILAFLNKRVRFQPELCSGRPGLVLPLNFLADSNIGRLSIAVAFGVAANNCFQLLGDIFEFVPSSLSVAEGDRLWDKVFRSVVWVLLYSVINFPIFACLMIDHLLVGAVFGFLYTLTRFIAVLVFLFSSCLSPYTKYIPQNELNSSRKHTKVLNLLPDVFCYLFLVGRFSVPMINKLGWCRGIEIVNSQEPVIAKGHDYAHVRLLLKNELNQRLDPSSNWYTKVMYRCYKSRRDFKFSTAIAAILLVSVILIYQMTVSLVSVANVLKQSIPKFREDIKHFKANTVAYEVNYSLFLLLDIVGASLTPSACLSAFFAVLMLLHFAKSHRRHVLITYKAKQFLNRSSSSHVTLSLSYLGLQIAYIGCGYIVLTIVLVIIVICFVIIIKAHLGVLLLVPVSVWIVQFLLGWLVVRDRRLPDKTININNHCLYCVISYFFVFFNILVGLFISFFRILKSMFLGVMFLSRIDHTPLGFSQWDEGYMSYIGFLNVLKSYSHPVVLVFCQHLLDRHQSRSRPGYDHRPYHPVSKVAVSRWFLAYTLQNNHDLRYLRKRCSSRHYFMTDPAAGANKNIPGEYTAI